MEFCNNSNITKVSVIIATLNSGQTLQRCLDSIYKQDFPNVEIVIMDGGSTDETLAVLERNDAHISFWESRKDDGIYHAFNKALDRITGTWVLFLGSDDELLAGFSDMCYELHEPSSIYYGSVLYKNRKCIGYVNSYKFAKLGLQHQAVFYHSSIFRKYRYDVRYKIAADYVLNLQCYKDKEIKIIFKDHIIANYCHTGISGYTEDLLLRKDKSRLVLDHFGILVWLRYMIKIAKKTLFK